MSTWEASSSVKGNTAPGIGWSSCPTLFNTGSQPDGLPREYSAKIKEQTRKLATDSSKHCFEIADQTDQVRPKHCFEVVDQTDQVSNLSTARQR